MDELEIRLIAIKEQIRRENEINNTPYKLNKHLDDNVKYEEYLKNANLNIPISIILTAYNTAEYIEECLDSIHSQDYKNIEILLGIDACEVTLKKIKTIKDKYENLKTFYFKENLGTYIVSNTLITLCNNENILRFDSDDYMNDNMLNTLSKYVGYYDIVRFRYYNKKEELIEKSNLHAHGVMCFTKTIFNEFGGYKPWRCAADTDLLNRISTNTNIKMKTLNEHLFVRRIHSDSLTRSNEYGMNSEIRNKYFENYDISTPKISITVNNNYTII